MTFLPNVDYERFDAFVREHPTKGHFLQSAAWGDFSLAQRGLTAHRVGLEDEDGQLRAAALLLERKPGFFPCYLYSPRGYVMDYGDAGLLEEMTAAVRDFARDRGAMFVAMDPDVERWGIEPDGSRKEGSFDNSGLIDRLLSLGYVHRGFNLGFEGREPRFTFRIDLTPDRKDIERSFTGNVMKNIKKSRHYSIRFFEGGSGDVPMLYDMITRTSERDDFFAYGPDYYQNFYDILAARDMAHLYFGAVNPGETVGLLEEELEETLERRKKLRKEGPLKESRETEERLHREIELFKKYAEEFPGEVIISAHLVVRYGKRSWAVHAGSRGIMNETFCNNRTYYEKLMAQKDAGCVFMDQFGTVGNPEQEGPFQSVHAFKRQWGGRYMEFIGEFDLVTRPFWFWLYEKARPAYRNLRLTLKEGLRRFRS